MSTVAPRAPVVIEVDAKVWRNPTGLDVADGKELLVSASGCWHDKQYPADAGGYTPPWLLALSSPLLRCRNAGWFELVGEIRGKRSVSFPIGLRPRVRVPAAGRLFLYANDVPGFYCNNRGALTVTITRSDPRA